MECICSYGNLTDHCMPTTDNQQGKHGLDEFKKKLSLLLLATMQWVILSLLSDHRMIITNAVCLDPFNSANHPKQNIQIAANASIAIQ